MVSVPVIIIIDTPACIVGRGPREVTKRRGTKAAQTRRASDI
jgi:hypothetical protein